MNHKDLYVRGLSGIVYYSLVYWIKWRQPEEMERGWKLETYASRKKADGGFLVVFWKIKTCKSLPLCQAHNIHIFSIVLENYTVESKFNLMLSHYHVVKAQIAKVTLFYQNVFLHSLRSNDFRMWQNIIKILCVTGPSFANKLCQEEYRCMHVKEKRKTSFYNYK